MRMQPSNRLKTWPISLAPVIGGVLAITGSLAFAAYAAWIGFRAARASAAIAAQVKDIRIQATTAHLRFEEIATRDAAHGPHLYAAHFDSAEASLAALTMHFSQQNGLVSPLVSQRVIRRIDLTRDALSHFRKLIEQRQSMFEAGNGNVLNDGESNIAFDTFSDTAVSLEKEVLSSLTMGLHRLRLQQTGLLVASFMLALACMVTAGWNTQRRRRAILTLQAANQQLDAANQQLCAVEQQLRAANQQLAAHEQQLRASNQQLHAANQALIKSEERYRLVLEHMSNALAVYQAVDEGDDFVFVEFNPAGQKIENTPRHAAIGRRLTEVFPGVKQFGVLDALRRVWKTGVAEHLPVSMYQDERIVGWRENHIFRLPTAEVVAIYSDETERMRALESLQQSEAIARLQCDIALALGSASSVTSAMEAVIDGCLKLTGVDCGGVYIVDEATGGLDLLAHRGLSEGFVAAASHYESGAPQTALVMKGEPVYRLHVELDVSIDELRRMEKLCAIAVLPIRHEGKVIAALNVASHTVSDFLPATRSALEIITASIGGALARIQAESALSALFRSSPAGIGLARGRRILKVSDRFCELSGYSPDKLIGENVEKLYASAEEYRRAGHELYSRLAQEGTASVEARVRKNDGSEADAIISLALIDPTNPHGIVAFSIIDISDLKRLRSERDRFFNNSIDMLCVAGLDGYFKQINPAWTRTLGWSAEELLSKPWLEFVHPDDREATVNVKSQLDGGCEVYSFENRYRCKDGSYRWISWNSFPVPEEGIMFGVARDVTAQRRAAEAVAESESKLRSIIDSAPFGMHLYRLDEKNDLIFEGANPAADRILGVDHRQFMGKKIEEAFPPLAATEVPDRYRAAASAGQPWQTEQISYQDDKIAGAFAVHAFQTSPGRMVAAFEEISARKRAEAALRASEARFRVYYESAPVAYQSLDEGGVILDVNDVWLQTLGYARDEVIGKSFADFLASGSKPLFLKKFSDFIIAGSTANMEFELIRKDGRTIVGLFFGRATRNEKGDFERTHCVFHDITERKRLMEEIQKTQRLESIGILAGGIAHDFNNLLGGLFGFIEMAREYGKIDETASEYLGKALKAFQRARDLTQQLLTFSRGGEPVKQPASVDIVVKNAVELALSGSNVQANITVGAGSLAAEIDQGQIAQTISNIVLNARQAMPMGGNVAIDIAPCRLSERDGFPVASGEYIRIRIQDHGTGIAPEHVEKIFDPFFTTKQAGSGLGLATAFSIVKRHRGHIAVASKLGEGSVFDVYLPALSAATAPADTDTALATMRGAGRILLMDDEQLLLDIGREALVSVGYEVECVRDGAAAVERYRTAMHAKRPFDAVILDLTVPGGMGGKETLVKLQEIDPAVRAIVSSGYSEDPVMSEPRKYGFVGVVRKPYRLADLGMAVMGALQRA